MKRCLLSFLAAMLLNDLSLEVLAQEPRFAPSHIPSSQLPAYYTGEALDLYGELTGKIILASISRLRLPPSISTNPPAGTNAARALIEKEIARAGFAVIPHGSQFRLVVPEEWRGTLEQVHVASLGPPPERGSQLALNTFNFPSVDIETFLNEFYAPLYDRILLRRTALPPIAIHFKTVRLLTHAETLHAFNVLLALNDIAAIQDGEKFIQIMPLAMKQLVQAHAPKPEPGAELLAPASIPVFETGRRWSEPMPSAHPQAAQSGPPARLRVSTTADLIDYYAKLTGRTVSSSPQLPPVAVALEIKAPVTKAELIHAIETTLALNGVAIVEVDEKTIRAGHISEKRKSPQPAGTAKQNP